MVEILTLLYLHHFQCPHIQIVLAGIVFLHNLLAHSGKDGIHIVDPHIGYAFYVDLCICQKPTESFVGNNLAKQPIVELVAFQNINHIIAQIQFMQNCVWVIFCFCQSQQIVSGYAIEFCQLRNRKGLMSLYSSDSYLPRADLDKLSGIDNFTYISACPGLL